jgi:hypothetical protein
MRLERLRHVASGERDISFDASRPLFRVGSSTNVSDLLMAIPMLKADPVTAIAPTGAASPFTMKVTVQTAGTLQTASYYDNLNDITELTAGLATSTDFPLARLGLRFSVPKLDSQLGAANTAGDAAEWRMYATAYAVLRQLDIEIVEGTGSAGPPQTIKGLEQLSSNRTAATTGNTDTDVSRIIREIYPNGTGVGEGIDCLIGSPRAMRKVMASTAGQSASSGFRIDRRTGTLIYHYLGIPFYRSNVEVTGAGLTKLYGANLGGTGLNLIHTVGSADTYGLTADIDELSTTRASVSYVVHGAYAVALWEEAAAFAITGFDVSTFP